MLPNSLKPDTPRITRMRLQVRSAIKTECLNWDMSLNADGYGQVLYMGKIMKAHRVAYHMHHGHFPVHGACHTCDNPKCFNPHHLFDGDQRANMRDAAKKGRLDYLRGPRHNYARFA